MRTHRLLPLLVLSSATFVGCAANRGTTSTIKPAGGSVTIDDVARVDVPPRAFEGPAEVTLRRVDRPDAREAFGEAARLFEVAKPLPYEYRITAAGGGRPRETVEVTVEVPARWRKSIRRDADVSGTVVRAFGRNVWTQGNRSLVTLEPLVGTVDAAADTIHVFVPPHLFAGDGSANTYEAVLRLGLVPEVSSGYAPVAHWTSKAAQEAPRDAQGRATAGNAIYLGPPLRGEYRGTTAFGLQAAGVDGVRQFHPGVDVAPDPAAGDAERDVLAMADGVVVAAGEQSDESDDDESAGWGNYVIVAHGRGGAGGPYTVYAGLSGRAPVARVGGRVTRGDVIGRLAKPAEGSPPRDLHVEYVSGGISPATLTKADPAEQAAALLVERVVAGARSTAVVSPPDIDADQQSAEARGTAAENGSWLFGTDAKANDGNGLAYRGGASADVVTALGPQGMRVVIDGKQSATVGAWAKGPTHPQGAAATGSTGGKLRFRTVGPATYRLRLTYSAPEGAGQWRVDTRLDGVASDGSAKPADAGIKSANGSGAVTFDQTFEGRLDPRTTYDFEFGPAVAHGGAKGQETLTGRAVLEVVPVRGEAK